MFKLAIQQQQQLCNFSSRNHASRDQVAARALDDACRRGTRMRLAKHPMLQHMDHFFWEMIKIREVVLLSGHDAEGRGSRLILDACYDNGVCFFDCRPTRGGKLRVTPRRACRPDGTNFADIAVISAQPQDGLCVIGRADEVLAAARSMVPKCHFVLLGDWRVPAVAVCRKTDVHGVYAFRTAGGTEIWYVDLDEVDKRQNRITRSLCTLPRK